MNGMRVMLWGGAAVAAVGIATAVTVAASTDADGGGVLSQADVARELAGDPAGSGNSASDPSAGDQGSAPVANRAGFGSAVSSRAGTLVVSCENGQATLERWTANAGYRVDDVNRGPAGQVSVWFESDKFDDVEAVVSCDGSRPVLKDLVEFDDHGRNRGDDNSGPGNGDDSDHDDNSNSGPGSGDDSGGGSGGGGSGPG